MTVVQPSIPLRIAILTDDFYPHSGGVARSIELQITELIRAGHDVTLFAPEPFFEPPLGGKYEACPVWRVPRTSSAFCALRWDHQRIDDICSRYKFDVVHSQNERGAIVLAAAIAKRQDIPHVHTFHSNYAATHVTSPLSAAINTYTFMKTIPLVLKQVRPDRRPGRLRLPHHLTSREDSRLAKIDWRSTAQLAYYSDSFTSPAQFVVDNINDATHGELANCSFVIPNGINPLFHRARRLRPELDSLRFLMIGRLDAEKRVDIAIRAFARLPKQSTELCIVGDGTVAGQLRLLARELKPANPIRFLGAYNEPERVANEMANADVFVFSSYRFDTQGMVLGEAASAGAALLYCDDRLHVGIGDDNSLLVHPSVSGFEDGMRHLLADIPAVRLMQQASRRIGARLTPQHMSDQFVHVYHHAINRYPSNDR
ncbi:MAG: glycosyltransferase [Candidatus Saccharimonadales bacterium]